LGVFDQLGLWISFFEYFIGLFMAQSHFGLDLLFVHDAMLLINLGCHVDLGQIYTYFLFLVALFSALPFSRIYPQM